MQQHRIPERRLAAFAVACAGVVWISHADGAQPSAPPDVADGDFGRGAEAENQRQSPVPQGFPHLLKDIAVTEPDQAWRTDIACIPLRRGFMHLVTVMDWATRFALSRRLSNSMGTEFCLEALDDALRGGAALRIFNTDQGPSSPAPPSRAPSSPPARRCRWTVRGVGWTTASSNGSGGRSSARRSTCTSWPTDWMPAW